MLLVLVAGAGGHEDAKPKNVQEVLSNTRRLLGSSANMLESARMARASPLPTEGTAPSAKPSSTEPTPAPTTTGGSAEAGHHHKRGHSHSRRREKAEKAAENSGAESDTAKPDAPSGLPPRTRTVVRSQPRSSMPRSMLTDEEGEVTTVTAAEAGGLPPISGGERTPSRPVGGKPPIRPAASGLSAIDYGESEDDDNVGLRVRRPATGKPKPEGKGPE